MLRCGLACLFVCFGMTITLPAQQAPAWADAPLRALFMVDAREGWAVGDDGVILHTLDGWESHETQKSGVRSSLRAIHFVDAYVGYAVGVEVLPYLRGTGGVVLGTRDGGVTWTKLIQRELPGLHAVKFVDADLGYAFGDTNGGHAGGVFRTENGGRSWKPLLTLDQTQSWKCAALVNEQPVVAGALGLCGVLEKEQVLPLKNAGSENACLLAMAGKGHDLWAVGTGSTVLLSRQTGGRSWEAVPVDLPKSLSRLIDFHTVCCQGDHVWLAGRPGSFILHSPDRGKTWETLRTAQSLPIHQLCFVSEKQGYAVGELGTILQTKDAGKSWAVVRRGGHRSAALFVSNSATRIPLGTIAVFGGDQGYVCVGMQASTEPGQWGLDRDQLHQAVRTVGGTSGEVLSAMTVADYQHFMPAGKVVDLIEQKRLLEQMVLALRMWRPSVVVCDSPDTVTAGSPLAATIALTLRQACDLCSRADVFPEHFTKLDLQPWQPTRLLTRPVAQAAADCIVQLDLPRPCLFASANDFANLARPLVSEKYVRGCEVETYQVWKTWNEPAKKQVNDYHQLNALPFLGLAMPHADDHRIDLFAGLTLGHGGQARREKIETDEMRFQLLENATLDQKQQAKPFFDKMNDPNEQKKFFSHFRQTWNNLTTMTIGDRIAAQAQEFADKGQWTMARECHLMLLDLLPTHRLAPESCRFVATMMGSSELHRREELGQMKHFADYVFDTPINRLGEAFEKQVSNQRTIVQRRRLELRRWSGGALAGGEIYSVLNPLGYGDPDFQFVQLANQRLDGRTEQSELAQSAFQWKYGQGLWNDAASSEQWIKQRIGTPAKPVMQALRTPEMPKLDGKLDDAIWKRIPVTTLKQVTGDTASQTTVQFAYDDTYLYVGVKCQQPAGMPVLAPVKPRKRDDDLRTYDRISLLLDLDRDYSTAFHLEFDARGCVMEDCCGDMTWNPQWFVEVVPGSDGWTAEVAIPLVELTGKLKLENEVWAMNITRIIPGQAVQAASFPAGVKPCPQGMGLLQFTDSPAK